ncbi:MAG: glycosyltransferase family 4 protein [Ardenticatenia bacterium]|nr:glycosyltransferase family 4 protein [Ardenticatenia bacterium]
MRILMLNNEFPPLGGGTGVVNQHLLSEWTCYPDIWVDLVTSSRSRQEYKIEPFADRITIYKVPVNNTNIHHASNRELFTYTWRGLLISRYLINQHCYDLSFAFAGVPAGGISYVLWHMAALPYVVSLQGPDVPGFEARYNYLYPFLKPVLRCIWSHAAAVTATSEEHRRLAHRTKSDLEILVIYNGVDTQTFCPSVQKKRQDHKVHILCVGRLIERKGHHYLLHAFAQLQVESKYPLHLTLVGTGDAEEALRQLAGELGIAQAVTFMGFVSREVMPAIYQQADVFVLPSQNEGMSIALLEAMASGLPVVVTNTGGTAELVREGVNGYIVPWADVPALVKALSKLISNQEVRQRMGKESRRIAERFSWKSVAKQYAELCRHIAARTSNRTPNYKQPTHA